jgi:DNA-binding MarR family transcriptional regulator
MTRPETSTEMGIFGDMVRLVHVVSQAGAAELRRHGLTPAQYQLMLGLRGTTNPLQQELSEQLGVTKGNVSQMVSRLESRGLVVRVPRGAGNELQLTEAGHHLIDRLLPDQRAFMQQQFGTLSRDELSDLAAILAKLTHSL